MTAHALDGLRVVALVYITLTLDPNQLPACPRNESRTC
jgi:hypothetical protein